MLTLHYLNMSGQVRYYVEHSSKRTDTGFAQGNKINDTKSGRHQPVELICFAFLLFSKGELLDIVL